MSEAAAKDAPLVGGQALIEGVMMRAARATAIALRTESGGIVIRTEPWTPSWTRHPILGKPFIRGAAGVVDAMGQGFRALQYSAERAQRGSIGLSSLLTAVAMMEGPRDHGRSRWQDFLPMLVSLSFAAGLFVALPHALTWLLFWLIGGPWDETTLVFHWVDGAFKLAIFVGYISLIGRVPEISRVFEYHGAEHKVVNAFERGRSLDLDEVRLQPTYHARCGTSFILSLLLISILVFAVVFPFLSVDHENPLVRIALTFLVKLPLMLPVAGLAYELNRLAARYPNFAPIQLIAIPGRWMQSLTTRTPDDSQLEIALAAMHAALQHRDQGFRDQEFASYQAFMFETQSGI